MKRIEFVSVSYTHLRAHETEADIGKLLQQKTWMLISGLGCISQMIRFLK